MLIHTEKISMKKIHWSVLLIIIFCLAILGILGYIGMTTSQEIPSNIIAVLASVISGLIGYSAGKGEEDG